jgi:hypothetical protein
MVFLRGSVSENTNADHVEHQRNRRQPDPATA